MRWYHDSPFVRLSHLRLLPLCSRTTVSSALSWLTAAAPSSEHCKATPGRFFTNSQWTCQKSTVRRVWNSVRVCFKVYASSLKAAWVPLHPPPHPPSGRGGQSALRFARLRMEKRHNYVRKVAETAVQLFVSNDKVNVAGMVLAGSADFKTELSQSDMFDPVHSLRPFTFLSPSWNRSCAEFYNCLSV